jgi:hypothetical protein
MIGLMEFLEEHHLRETSLQTMKGLQVSHTHLLVIRREFLHSLQEEGVIRLAGLVIQVPQMVTAAVEETAITLTGGMVTKVVNLSLIHCPPKVSWKHTLITNYVLMRSPNGMVTLTRWHSGF